MTSLTQTSALSDSLLDKASWWVARLSSDQLGESDLQAFALWLAESESHKLAYDEIADLWLDLGVVKHLPLNAESVDSSPVNGAVNGKTIDDTALSSSSNVVNLFGETIRGLSSWPKGLALAASVVFAIALMPNLLNNSEPQRFSTAIGELESIDLADGSTITLNTNTRLEVLLSDKQRRITLEHGEAFFEVAKDSNRPFIVESCSSEVQAIGTAFNVHCSLGSSAVAVTEGIVKVTDIMSNRSAENSQTLKMGESIVLQDTGGLMAPDKIDINRIASWRRGELIFSNTRLSDVLDEINRYSNRPIGLGSPELQSIRVTGRFGLEDRALLLKALKRSLSLSSETSEDGTVRLIPIPAG